MRSRPLSGRSSAAPLAQTIAAELGVEFAYSEPRPPASTEALLSVVYRLPGTFAPLLRGKRVAIVDDAVNAGSAVRGTFRALILAGVKPVVVGALLVLAAPRDRSWSKTIRLELEFLATLNNPLWEPSGSPFVCSRRAAGRGPSVKGEPRRRTGDQKVGAKAAAAVRNRPTVGLLHPAQGATPAPLDLPGPIASPRRKPSTASYVVALLCPVCIHGRILRLGHGPSFDGVARKRLPTNRLSCFGPLRFCWHRRLQTQLRKPSP